MNLRMASPVRPALFLNEAGFSYRRWRRLRPCTQGVRTPPSLELLDWALPSGFTIARSSGMDRRSKRDPLLRMMEWAKLANPESAVPETMARRRSSLLRGFMRSAAVSCVSDRSRMAETRPWAWFRRSREHGPKGNAQTRSVKNTSLIESGRKRIHKDERRLLSLVGIDERDQPREMLGPAMGVQCRPIWPFFDEDEMSGVFFGR